MQAFLQSTCSLAKAPITLCVAVLVGAMALGAKLELGDAPPQPISELAVGGYNIGNWMPLVEFAKELKPLQVNVVRFPGGNVGDDNDLIPQVLQPLTVNLPLLKNPKLIVQTRVFGGGRPAKNGPEDAAQAARDARQMGLEPLYWQIGNEPNLYAITRSDPTWTVERYCQTFRAQREAILKVNPKARFAGPGVSGDDSGAKDFLIAFLKQCGDVVDLLAWHIYPSGGELSDEAALASISTVNERLERYKKLVKDPEANPLGYTRDIRLGVTEYSLSWQSNRPRHTADQVAGLWAAEATLRLAEGGAEVVTYFALQGVGGHGMLDIAGIPRPTYYAFQQVQNFRGQALQIKSDNPDLWVHAAEQGNLLNVFAINPTTQAVSLETPLPDWDLIGAKGFTEQTVKDEADFIRFKLGSSLSLPPRSLVRIAYKATPLPLRVLAERRGLLVGAAVGGALYDSLEPEYGQILAKEFNFVTPENTMKWEALSQERGQYSFAAADALVAFAQKNGQKVRGHTLVWHQQLPNWLRRQSFTRDELLAVLKEHIQTVVGHFKGKVAVWDVVNEAQVDDGSGLRSSLFRDTIGPDFLEYAFRYAHEADPEAKLFYNDYNTEGLNPKSNAVYAMLKALKEKGVPIDGVGIQTHVDSSFSPQGVGMPQNLRRLAELGLEVHITEMDVKQNAPGSKSQKLEAQARVYLETLETCIAEPACKAFTLWGLSDGQSWLAASQPLIFDVSYQPKPAYYALQNALRNK